MHCSNCGNKLDSSSDYCTSCGEKISGDESTSKNKGWSFKKTTISIIISIALTSLVWFLILGQYGLAVERESVSIVSSMLENIGRQEQAWQNSQKINELIVAGLSDECSYDIECINEVESQIISLEAINEKELEEIGKLWSSGPIVEDFSSFYNYISPQNKAIIKRIFDQYFPEETEDITNSVQLL